MATSTNKNNPASNLLAAHCHGVLSTISEDLVGYPFGSLLPYCLDQRGYPLILISRLARHTKNIHVDPRTSLLVAESGVDNIQKAARLTYVGRAVPLINREDAARYYRYFPQCVGYETDLDFEFHVLEPVSCYFVGGFGRITPYSPESVTTEISFEPETEMSIVQHMNQDHVAAMETYCQGIGRELVADESPLMAGVDRLGFHLRIDEQLLRFNFTQPVSTAMQVREELVALAKG